MYDRFSEIKFWSNERNTEYTMLHLCFSEVIILRKIQVKMKSFAPP